MIDKKYVAGLDVGTTGCKIAVYDKEGILHATYYTEYDSTHSAGLHEINFNDVKAGVLSVLKQAVSEFTIFALGVTSFGETFAMLDENDNILAPSMLYTDPRGEEQCDALSEKLGKEKLTIITGVEPNKMYSIYKIMWLRDNMPDNYSKCKKILLGEDFIVYSLTGKRQIDYSLAARTGAFDIREKVWYKEAFDSAQIPLSMMSEPVEAGTVAGYITGEIKNQLGIDFDIVIVNGCHDQVASMIGAGVFETGIAMDGTGTVECIPVVMDGIPQVLDVYKGGYSVVPFVNDKYACYALSFTGGATLKWFRDNFAEIERKMCESENKNVYAYLDSKISEKPTDILVLPHFAGAATPYMDTDAKAAFVGITLETTKYDIYRALMEGTSFEMLINYNVLKKYTGDVREIRATGGGASSDVWLQIKADILGTMICSMSCKEVGCAGTAALAGTAVGMFDNLYSAVNMVSAVSKRYYPNHSNAKIYADKYLKYKDLYKAVNSLGKGESDE